MNELSDGPSTSSDSRDIDGVMSSTHPPVHGLHSRVIGRVGLDQERLDVDIATLLGFPFNRGYSDYARGNPGWQNCVLMNHNGDENDIVFGGHDGPPVATPLLEQLPYITELLASTWKTEHLLWARIFMCEDGMLIPHRDYLDLPEDEFTRAHIPLQLGDASMHSEQGSVFRMRKGEVWFIDGTVNHSAYSYDGEPRVYLSADLRAGVPFDELFVDPSLAAYDVKPDIVTLPALPDEFDVTIEGLSKVLGPDTMQDVIGVLSKVHFNHQAECGDTYEWLIDVASRTCDTTLVNEARETRAFFLGA